MDRPPPSTSLLLRNGTLSLPQALVSLLKTCLVGSDQRNHTDLFSCIYKIGGSLERLLALLNPFDARSFPHHPIEVVVIKTAVLCGTAFAFWNIYSRHGAISKDASITDPGLLRKYSTMQKYTVPATGFTYPGIRTYYQAHAQEKKLPQEPTAVPLLVFIHGLGGSTAQFHPILTELTNTASCLAIDLPGCGVSEFSPTAWEAYTTGSLVHLLATVIDAHRKVEQNQQVVLIGHSLGCSLAVMLASSTSPYAHLLSKHVAGLVALCPQAEPLDSHKQRAMKIATWIPTFLFDIMRKRDRRGGVNSPSVIRMTGPDADEQTKKLQLRYNEQSRSAVWKRMARGMIGAITSKPTSGGLPGQSVWAGLLTPVLLIAGNDDSVTPFNNINIIANFIENRDEDSHVDDSSREKGTISVAAAPIDPAIVEGDVKERKDSAQVQKQVHGSPNQEPPKELQMTSSPVAPSSSCGSDYSVQKVIVDAGHSLPFSSGPTHHRILEFIDSFLAQTVDFRLDPAWQTKYFSTEGKWDVKNLQKWQAVAPVSPPIANTFRALKTLRGVDKIHCPRVFVEEWAGKLKAVLDISHDTPVYDPKELVAGGITYCKLPMVSKQSPSIEDVAKFVKVVDEMRGEGNGNGGPEVIGVHCHYGFNRTGFFIVSYLVERLGYKVEDAIEEFAKARSPGIKHAYFVRALHRRYQGS